MDATERSASLLHSINEVNTAIAVLIVKTTDESREILIDWIKADLALLEQLRSGFEAKTPPRAGACSDTLCSALDSTISAKCLALAALQEAQSLAHAARAKLN